jgi:hypothetical protein
MYIENNKYSYNIIEDHTTLLYFSQEIKNVIGNCEENILEEIEGRFTNEKIASSIKYYHSIKTYHIFADTSDCKTQINELIVGSKNY